MKTLLLLFCSMFFLFSCSDAINEPAKELSADEMKSKVEAEEIPFEEASIQDSIVKKQSIVREPRMARSQVRAPILPYDDRDPRPIPGPMPPPPPPMPKPVIVGEPIVQFPEVIAEYIGGDAAMKKFISETITYPDSDVEMGNQGRVYVRFIVEKDGSLTSIEVARGVSSSLDREAKRIVRAMPNWKPAEHEGKIVRSKMIIPIAFILQ